MIGNGCFVIFIFRADLKAIQFCKKYIICQFITGHLYHINKMHPGRFKPFDIISRYRVSYTMKAGVPG